MTKENGEAAHVSVRRIADQLYFIAGSKNVHLIFRDRTVKTLYTRDNTIDTYENLGEPIMITRAETHGCGCFIIYSKRNGRGDAEIIPEHHTFRADFRVSSFKRIEC